ncbi:ABC transporter permease [Acidithiobacillus ferridurans]|jgi:NitT/TauT family transport system permease protein|uniref:ABC transporter permease n=1 Tax=Acidithiobacillus ferridurans TaxID=1232575 RepID=UPI001C067BD7|nr:ABC transporter permease [Acidithiobacillus ferridurans]MBU2731757.1 ABC transporter permease [Acidithiobacillus ferridurans]
MMALTNIRDSIPRWAYISFSIAGFIIPLAAWQIMSSMHIFNALFLPSPERVFKSFERWTAGNLWEDTYISTYRVVSGFLLAAAIGVPIGIYIGTFKMIEAMLQPINDFIRYMPASAFIPLVLLWIGIGESAKISIIFIGVFFQIVVMVADAVRNVPQKYIEAAYTMGAKKGEVLNYVIFKGAAPDIFNILRVNMGWAWTYLVIAEMVAADRGLGFAILQAQRFMDTPKIFVGIIIIGILGLLFDLSFRIMHRIVFVWSYK